MRDESWRDRARCQGLDTEWFFPQGRGDFIARVGEVAAICGPCPVRRECYDYAVETKSIGIWGGKYFGAFPAGTRRKCRVCQVEYIGQGSSKCCSRAHTALWARRAIGTCKQCEATIFRDPVNRRKDELDYCSVACKREAKSAQAPRARQCERKDCHNIIPTHWASGKHTESKWCHSACRRGDPNVTKWQIHGPLSNKDAQRKMDE